MLLHDIVTDAAGRAPDDPALIFGDTVTTFGALAARVGALAGGLGRLAQPGDRVAILAESCPAYVDAYYGVPAAAMGLTLLNFRLHPDEWLALLARAAPAVLLGERALLDRLDGRLASLPAPPCVVAIDEAGPGERAYADLLASAGGGPEPGPGPLPGAPAGPRPDDLAWLIFTSGTTGAPKGAMLTHASLLAAVEAAAAARPVADDDVYLFPFPLCHVAGYNLPLLHRHRRPVVLLRRFDPAEVLAAIGRHRVTSVSLAPTMIASVLDHPGLAGADLSSLRTVQYGASAIAEPLLRRGLARFGCDFAQGFGMTELSGNAVFLSGADHRRALAGAPHLLGAAGKPAPGVEVRMVDDAGAPVAPGEVGEIAVRAPQVMAGYWHDDAATAAAFTGGWFRTGDLGRVDPEGYVYVVDRKKDIIVTGGENVASREVEDVLAGHPAVAEVAVIGVPDPQWGEAVCAVVVARPGVPLDPADLVAHARAHLAGFKKPRHVVEVAGLPKNVSGKVLKAELRRTIGPSLGPPAGDR